MSPTSYNASSGGPLVQGEILDLVYDYRASCDAGAQPVGGDKPPIIPIRHPCTVVMHPTCDLEQDFNKVRFSDTGITMAGNYEDSDDPRSVNHVLLCDAYEAAVIISRCKGENDVRAWKGIRQNDHKRYHFLASVGTAVGAVQVGLPDLVIDFKRVFTVPLGSLYEGVRTQRVKRVACVASPYVHDLCQRFYAFLSRVGVPD